MAICEMLLDSKYEQKDLHFNQSSVFGFFLEEILSGGMSGQYEQQIRKELSQHLLISSKCLDWADPDPSDGSGLTFLMHTFNR